MALATSTMYCGGESPPATAGSGQAHWGSPPPDLGPATMADSADAKATSRKRKSKAKRRSLAVLAGYSPGTLPVLDSTTSTRKLVDNGDSGNAIRAMDDLAVR